jgi:hypothetical protein
VRFTTASALVSELIEARDEKHLLRAVLDMDTTTQQRFRFTANKSRAPTTNTMNPPACTNPKSIKPESNVRKTSYVIRERGVRRNRAQQQSTELALAAQCESKNLTLQ